MSVHLKKFAFTLAEVLITLGIIGIVAALTIPNLISQYQKHVLYNQFLKAASTIENAVKMYNLEKCGDTRGGCMELYGTSDNYGAFLEGISKYLGITEKNNFPIIKDIGIYTLNKEYYEPPLFVPEEGLEALTAFVITKNGMLIAYDVPNFGDEWYVDINGLKGPNTIGRDIFFFKFDNKENFLWKGTKKYKESFGNAYWKTGDCKDLTGAGYTCAGRLLEQRKMDY